MVQVKVILYVEYEKVERLHDVVNNVERGSGMVVSGEMREVGSSKVIDVFE